MNEDFGARLDCIGYKINTLFEMSLDVGALLVLYRYVFVTL
jgi:hypothetical protein